MRKTIIAALIAGASLTLTTTAVMAQEVQFTGEKCPLTIITNLAAYESGDYSIVYETETASAADSSADGETVAAAGEDQAQAQGQEQTQDEEPAVMVYSLSSINVLGVVNENYVAVTYADNKTGYALTEELQENVPALHLENLESVNDWTDVGRGSGGERTVAVQQALSDLKLLEGNVDGAFGNGTASSVEAFQKKCGLKETGVVDAATYFLLMAETGKGNAMSQSEALVTAYPPVYKVEDKFAAICYDVEDPDDLKAFLDPVWKFEYDVFEGEGRIDYTKEGINLGAIDSGSRFIDKLHLEGNVHVEVQRGENNVVSLIPVLEINTLGSYRPYIQSATLKSGLSVCELECVYTEGGLSGIDSTEKAWLLLNEDIAGLLTSNSSTDELVLRIHGLHQDYDMDLSASLNNIYGFVGSYVDPDAMIAENAVTGMEEAEAAASVEEQSTEEDSETETEDFDEQGVDQAEDMMEEIVEEESEA